MNKLIASIAIFSMLSFAVLPVIGATTDDVVATVTAELVAVSVSSGTVAYGTLGLDITEDTVNLAQTQTATNDGNVNVDLSVKSSDAVAGTPWDLAAARGSDEFTHEFSTSTGASWTGFDLDNNVYSDIVTGVAALGTQDFDLRIGTPTFSTDPSEHTVTVTVLATAS